MKLKIFQVDAFSKKPFGGNPAAIVPLDAWLADEAMLKIAVENNLSETAFFVPDNGKYHIRWFTPAVEVNLCGHATLAASHVIFNELGLETEKIHFHSDRSGELGVTKDGDRLVLDFPAYPMTEIEPVELLATAEVPPLQYWESQGARDAPEDRRAGSAGYQPPEPVGRGLNAERSRMSPGPF